MFIEKELGKTFDEIDQMYILFHLSNRKISAACRPLLANFANINISDYFQENRKFCICYTIFIVILPMLRKSIKEILCQNLCVGIFSDFHKCSTLVDNAELH